MSKEPAKHIQQNLLTKLWNLLAGKHKLQRKPVLPQHDGYDESNRTTLVAWAKLYFPLESEGGISYPIRGRLVRPSKFPNDHKNAWSMIIMLENLTYPGTYFEGPITLMCDDNIKNLFVPGNTFEYAVGGYKKLAKGEIISVKEVSYQEMRDTFKLGIWPGTTHILEE